MRVCEVAHCAVFEMHAEEIERPDQGAHAHVLTGRPVALVAQELPRPERRVVGQRERFGEVVGRELRPVGRRQPVLFCAWLCHFLMDEVWLPEGDDWELVTPDNVAALVYPHGTADVWIREFKRERLLPPQLLTCIAVHRMTVGELWRRTGEDDASKIFFDQGRMFVPGCNFPYSSDLFCQVFVRNESFLLK